MKPQPAASVLVFAVLLLAAGVFVLAGIAQLAATQALIGQNEWEALDRRIRLQNSRSIARQYVLSTMFAASISSDISFTSDEGLGGFTLSPISGTNPQDDYWTTISTTNTIMNIKINPFTLMERGGFYRVVVPGSISDGVDNVDWNFQVRTRSPITAGYAVVQHKPANNDITNLSSSAYIDMNQSEQIIGFSEMARMRVSSVSNTDNDPTGYDGYLDVPIGLAAWSPFTGAQVEAIDDPMAPTEVQILIDLGTPDSNQINPVLIYEVPAFADYTVPGTDPEIVLSNLPVVSVRLLGTEISNLAPLQIIVPSSNTNVTSLKLSGRNPGINPPLGRPVYFNLQRISNSGVPFFVSDAGAVGQSWRLGMSAAHSDVVFETPGINIVGGIRTDGAIFGAPSLRPELAPGGLDYIADRMMWLEDYKTP